MGLFSRTRETKEMSTHRLRPIPHSSSMRRHYPHVTDSSPVNDPPIRSNHPERPVYDQRLPPPSPGPSTSFPSLAQDIMHIFPRDAKDLHREAFYGVYPSTGTDYPCTTEDLNASGGIARQSPLRGSWQEIKVL